MLVIFKSKAAAEVLMYEEHAKRILDLLNKDVTRGVITSEETPQAVARLEQEIAESRKQQEQEELQRNAAGGQDQGRDDEREQTETVSFATRAYPLLEMLRAARKSGHDVMWGV